jgi:hypothetical protein
MTILLPVVLLGSSNPAPHDEADARAVVAKFKEKDPGMGRVFAEATGYAA